MKNAASKRSINDNHEVNKFYKIYLLPDYWQEYKGEWINIYL